MINIKFYYFFFLSLFSIGLFAQSTLEEREAVSRGNEFFSQKKWDLAQTSYAKALIINPSSVNANYNMGNLFYQQKLYSKAGSFYQKALANVKESQKKAMILHNIGNNLMKEKKYQEAEKIYKQSLLINPKDDETRYNYALAKKMIQQKKDKKNEEKLLKPTIFAQQIRAKADRVAEKYNFEKALDIMEEGLKRDSTVNYYKGYINKLKEINMLDSVK